MPRAFIDPPKGYNLYYPIIAVNEILAFNLTTHWCCTKFDHFTLTEGYRFTFSDFITKSIPVVKADVGMNIFFTTTAALNITVTTIITVGTISEDYLLTTTAFVGDQPNSTSRSISYLRFCFQY